MTKQYKLKGIEDLRPSPTNPRTISEQAKSGLRYSLEEFGDISGITWNKRSGNLVGGHQRLDQLKELGAELKAYGDRSFLELPDNTRFPVRVVDWDEDKEAAANLAANNEEIAGRWIPETAGIIKKIMDRNGEMYGNLRFDELLKKVSEPQSSTWSDALAGIPSRESRSFEQMTFNLSTEQAIIVRAALDKAKKHTERGANHNGAALVLIAEVYNGKSESDDVATNHKESSRQSD